MRDGRPPTPDETALWAAYTSRPAPLWPAENCPGLPAASPASRGRRLGTGPYELRLDLHGLSLQQAHHAVLAALDAQGASRSVLVVTGRSGAIRHEFSGWLDRHPRLRRIEPLSSGGAYRLHLRRPRTGDTA